ncbi:MULTISPECIES: phosphoglucomutase/phosphomannomutase family protein [unclassified Leptolyngbya]|uniref:phosphoglucomutase/phosphomannomutase family protein n=1 Tax=unclassified Leptolyngbya TaxID=2650499 RepID=UPI001687F4F4|nr:MULTISPECIES: phosphoglucomutase/phosphomannomutase family protein [unclassified Leptolyngbya]MBD1909970.1 phosphoglucomutase/phosphomannomutase family protein [Leptolyngbya sp. FACHB-8]MBD2156043.1 phosphoglucomutase/phosphomannomutase family protein [Leptolyngbya sp. FACHB-16]
MAGPLSPASFVNKPISFGTDGWRGMIAADFTFDRVMQVAPRAAIALQQTYGDQVTSKTVIVGYDRRFLSVEFAQIAAESIQKAGFDVLLSECFAPTPAFSWAAKQQNALGAIVITASHNPAAYSGLKIKGYFGGSVPPEVTKTVEAMLTQELPQTEAGTLTTFNPWTSYCEALRGKVNLDMIQKAIASGQLVVFADVMHGAAATGLEQILGIPVREINGEADPLFGGGAPEPLPRYLPDLLHQIKTYQRQGNEQVVGLVFDGDSDRIAAVDGQGNFLSSQILIPVLIQHLATHRGFTGEIVKTISGSNLIPEVAKLHGLELYQTPVGYKYIADRMLESKVFLGGEESGGIGYGNHIPERDALLSALYVLEAVVQAGRDLSDQYADLQAKTGFDASYDRIDLPLANMEARDRVLTELKTNPPTTVAGHAVTDCLDIDGYKFQLADQSWLLIRFSGTEPVLRLYSEAPTMERVQENLAWAKNWALAL